MKNYILIAILFSFFLISCSSEDDSDNQDNPSNGMLLQSIELNGQTIMDFDYNANKLSKKTIYNGNASIEIIYTYDNQLIVSETAKQNNNTLYQHAYSYNNGKLIRCDIVGAVNSYWSFTYTDDKITEAIKYISGFPSQKHSYSYDGDNIVEAIAYNNFGGNWERETSFEMEYDAKNNPISVLKIPFSEVLDEFANLTSKNNATRVHEYDNSVLVQTTNYTYTYNAQQYPLTANGGNNNYTFTYQP